MQQRGYLEPVLTLDGTLDKYPQLKNHKTNGRPGLAVFWQGVCWSGVAAASYSAQVTSYCKEKKKRKNWPLRRVGGRMKEDVGAEQKRGIGWLKMKGERRRLI